MTHAAMGGGRGKPHTPALIYTQDKAPNPLPLDTPPPPIPEEITAQGHLPG